MLRKLSFFLFVALLSGCLNVTVVSDGRAPDTGRADEGPAAPSPIPEHQRDSAWYRAGERAVAQHEDGERARNVVLFVGDGMGVSTVTAARILAGQRAGGSGEEHSLSFETFPVTGLAKTYNVDAQTPDSAGTMSAIVTGVKTRIGMFGLDEQARQQDCASASGRELMSILDIAELAGRATGVVSTARLTHATPAATYARTVERDWEDDAGMPEEARAAGCVDIATQFVNHRDRLNGEFGDGASDGIEVALGGGRQHFLPGEDGGSRGDGVDLVQRWEALYPGGSFAGDADTLARLRRAPVLGLFSDSHMDYELQRRAPENTQPSLVAMTLKALELLQQQESGFLLVVEAGRIDHGHHAGNAANALNETIELADAVAAVMAAVDPDNTLLLVTADHSHVFTMAGYPRRGNPILGKVIAPWSDEPTLADDGLPYTTLGYMNGRGFRDLGDEPNADATYTLDATTGRQDISNADTLAPGYHQEALIPINAETHGGEDVAVYARGPGAAAAGGSYEQNRLFHVMLKATGWDREAARRLARGPR
jgi:alkaline phosphatase